MVYDDSLFCVVMLAANHILSARNSSKNCRALCSAIILKGRKSLRK